MSSIARSLHLPKAWFPYDRNDRNDRSHDDRNDRKSGFHMIAYDRSDRCDWDRCDRCDHMETRLYRAYASAKLHLELFLELFLPRKYDVMSHAPTFNQWDCSCHNTIQYKIKQHKTIQNNTKQYKTKQYNDFCCSSLFLKIAEGVTTLLEAPGWYAPGVDQCFFVFKSAAFVYLAQKNYRLHCY